MSYSLMTWMTCPLCSAQTLYVHVDGMAQKDVMRAAEPMSLFFVIDFVFRITEAELEKSAAEQISSRTVSKTHSRAVMTASGTDRFSINNRFEVLYLVCITWMVRGTVTANSKRL